MRINKILCDICDKEIDFDYDYGIGTFQKIELVNYSIFRNSKIKNDQHLNKKELDLCDNCCDKVYDYINKLKNESK